MIHDVVFRIRTFHSVEVDLSDRAPVRPNLGNNARRQCHLRKPLQNSLAVLEVRRVLAEYHFHGREPKDRPRSDMGNSWNAVHHGLKRDGYLLLDLLGGNAGPLRNDINVIVRNVGISLHRQPMEGDDAPGEEQNADCKDKKAVLKRKVDQPAYHCASTVDSN